ncbi:hypothetical protein F5Y18DRAFT_112516 [Xylariaceae sp. FL1019]|nr:hypothetical protein F5Y18DRAFT_112516 [Xylariaceae sp. FL1019]
MYFSTVAITTLLGLVSAQKLHVVSVSSANKSLTFSPNNLQAAVGEMVQFQFVAGNHSVVQSNFDNPCEPIALHNTSAVGMFSGYMDVAAGESTGMNPVYTMMISATTPIWLYCSQGKHCQAGMTMVINENTAANATRSLSNYNTIAANVATALDPISAGTASGTTDGSGSSSGSGTGSSAPASSTSAVPTALGSTVSVSAWTGLLTLALGMMLL